MDQRLLVFVTVAEKENFSRAAEELHMTQPAVSQYIQALERTIGTRLLDRSNKYVRLNKAGEVVYHHAKEILGLYTRMQSLVDDLLQQASGKLSIGASYTFGEYVLPHIIAYMHEHYPHIQPTISIANTTEIAELVAGQQFDIGIVEGEFKDKHERLVSEPFAEDQMYVIASVDHHLAQQSAVCLADLQQETWIVREVGSGTREAADKLFNQWLFQPQQLMEFGSTQIIKESVEAGLGLALLSSWAIRKELSLGTLRILNLPSLPFTRKFSLVTQASSFQTKALQVFLKILREHEGYPQQ